MNKLRLRRVALKHLDGRVGISLLDVDTLRKMFTDFTEELVQQVRADTEDDEEEERRPGYNPRPPVDSKPKPPPPPPNPNATTMRVLNLEEVRVAFLEFSLALNKLKGQFDPYIDWEAVLEEPDGGKDE